MVTPKTPRPWRPTPAIRRVLTAIAAGRDPYADIRGNSAHGGMTAVIRAINRRRLVCWGDADHPDRLTDAGRAALGLPAEAPHV